MNLILPEIIFDRYTVLLYLLSFTLVSVMLFVFILVGILIGQLSLYIRKLFKLGDNVSTTVFGEGLETEAYTKALRILDDARLKAIKLYSQSQNQAQVILKQAIGLSEEKRKELRGKLTELYKIQENSLQQFNREIANDYKSALEQQNKENIQSLTNVVTGIKNEVVADLEEFKASVKKETIESQKTIEEKIRTSYEELEKELAVYKQNRITELNKSIYAIITEVSNGQEEFILKALDEELTKFGLKHGTKNNGKN
jgi:hypothetical protein